MYLQLCFAKENSHHNPLIVTTHLKILRTFKKFNKFSELSFQTVESFQMMLKSKIFSPFTSTIIAVMPIKIFVVLVNWIVCKMHEQLILKRNKQKTFIKMTVVPLHFLMGIRWLNIKSRFIINGLKNNTLNYQKPIEANKSKYRSISTVFNAYSEDWGLN